MNTRLVERVIPTAVKILDPFSSSSPDGFNAYFYVTCWSIVGPEVVLAIQSFFIDGKIPLHYTSNLVILISKVPHADSVYQLCPIALANFVFKITTRILTYRLGLVASRIVSSQQHAS